MNARDVLETIRGTLDEIRAGAYDVTHPRRRRPATIREGWNTGPGAYRVGFIGRLLARRVTGGPGR